MTNNIINFLQNEIDEKKLSHAFLIETNNCEKVLKEIINLLIKNDLVEDKSIENNISIKLITPENNLIDKNKILDLQKFCITMAIVKEYKVYFIMNAETMNSSAYNKLLKVLEEPSDSVIGFLITENESLIIPTIKSRCKKFVQYYSNNKKNNINNELAEKILIIPSMEFESIIKLKKEILKYDKLDIINIIQTSLEIINEKLSTTQNISLLANYYKILDNIRELIKMNVNIELCLDRLVIEMRK